MHLDARLPRSSGPSRSPKRARRLSIRLGAYRSSRVDTAQGRVHLIEVEGRGSLPPVVLLHGFAASALTYLPLFRRLRPYVSRIIAPDLPAHGRSDAPRDGLHPLLLSAELREALDQVLDEPAVIFGNSLGGAAALDYARHRPVQARALILASPGGAAMSEGELASLASMFEVESHAEALAFVDRLLVRPTRLRALYALGIRRRFARPHLRRFLRAVRADDLFTPEHLAALEMPILLLWGRGDRILPPEHLSFFRRHLPTHALVEEPEAQGHCPFLDDAAGLTERMVRFMRSLSAEQRRTSEE